MSLIVAIDGPSGAGKGTITKQVGEKLKLINIDTGAMYRCVTIYMLRNHIQLKEKKRIEKMLKEINIELKTENGIEKVYLNQEDVTREIRTKEVNELVSQVSHVIEIRESITNLSRKIAQGKEVIMEGRDIGTNVFPNADLKIYLDATPEERVNRRLKQNREKGIESSYKEILENIKFRDYNDKTSKVAPLKQAEDAIYIDSTNMTIEEVVDKIVGIIKERDVNKK